MSISGKIRTVFRGHIAFYDLPREAWRRRMAANHRRSERRDLDRINESEPRLASGVAHLDADGLLAHFRNRGEPFFWTESVTGIERGVKLQAELFPEETHELIERAKRITRESSWELAGLGELRFETENFWRRDPLGSKEWGLDYHADVVLYEKGGADVRVLWELNRFGHAVTLALVYAVTDDE